MTAARILIVDDEPPNVRLLERVLEPAGCTNVTGTTDPRRVAALTKPCDIAELRRLVLRTMLATPRS